MAGRKDKNTVDYFPHFCVGGKTMFILESKFGNDGYAVWFKILELLGSSENHYIDCRNASDWEFLQAKMQVDSTKLESIITCLCNAGAIHTELWENRIIWSLNFTKNIVDAYKRRTTKCMDFIDLCEHLSIICKHKYNSCGEIVCMNTQSKVKESKEKKIKADNEVDLIGKFKKEYPFVEDLFLEPFKNWIEYKKDKGQKYASAKSAKIAYDKLVSLSNNNPTIAVKVVEQSMGNSWAGLFELKNTTQLNGKTDTERMCYFKSKHSGEGMEIHAPFSRYELEVKWFGENDVTFLRYAD